MGKRCSKHGGLLLPPGEWVLLHVRGGLWLWNRDEAGSEKLRVSWNVGHELLREGSVTRSLFAGRGGTSLITRLDPQRYTTRLVLSGDFLREYEIERRPP